jgi:hypothetical protein
MAMLQVVASGLAQVDRLAFHSVDPAGTGALHQALALLPDLAGDRPTPVPELIRRIVARRFEWGMTDGN